MIIDNLIARQIKKFIFSFNVDKNGCWIWKKGKTPQGYPCFYSLCPRTNKRIDLAHRFSFSLFNGSIPDGMMICHKCDNPSCVNPDHLFAGTHDDNMKDKVKKKRQIHGPMMHNAKLNWKLVRKFRNEYLLGNSCTQLSKKYGYHESTIADVVKKRSWKHDPQRQ